ncbi:MAG TPA: MRP family ATP-binding protein, partial [Armatimonadetes bacterium]|nr:MRP family ATP-binding protein [Armatimonadota bacterium]
MRGEGVSREEVLSALRRVRDPEIGRDIVELGFVRDLVIEEGRVRLVLQLTTPACPFRRQIVEEAKRAVEGVSGVESVEVEVRASVPAMPRKERLPGVKHVVAVASGKGGVGKTTISVNLAVALALDGAKVGLLDADIYGPDVPLMMGVEGGRPEVRGERIIPIERHGVKVMSIGLLVEREAAVIWRGPLMSR